MNESTALGEIVQSVRRIEPAARLVPRRALRRAIRLSRDAGEFHTAAVHDRCWRIRRDRLFHFVSPLELGIDEVDAADEFLLIPLPPDLNGIRVQDKLWRTLFHAAIDREFDRAVSAGTLELTDLRSLREWLGPAQWHSIQVVLREENLIGENEATEIVLRECVAFALELRHFQPELWSTYFPGLKTDGEPFRAICQILNPEKLFEQTRIGTAKAMSSDAANKRPVVVSGGVAIGESLFARLQDKANRGNDLLAAVSLFAAGDERATTYRDRLFERLRVTLELEGESVEHWRVKLGELLPEASTGGWPIARRLLYDLQRACLAVEKMSYSIDLVEWAITFGKLPVVRPLPRTKWLDATRRLRSAAHLAAKLSPEDRGSHSLEHLIMHAAEGTEHKAREELRPGLQAVLQEVGLVPRSQAEMRSLDKLVEELLDAACTRGFLRIGDLRDAIARGRVKLADLSGPGEWLQGDAILQANSILPVRMSGVYRRGEIYMRLLQRGCSLFFGTRPGRLFTKFVALPFGGAFIILEGLHHMVEAGEGAWNWISGWNRTIEAFSVLGGGPAGTIAEKAPGAGTWVNPYTMGSIGLVLLLLIHLPTFRQAVMHALRLLVVKIPRTIWHSQFVRLLIRNAPTRFLRRYLLIPLATGALAGFAYQALAHDWTSSALVGSGVALFMGSFFRTPFGRIFEDRLDETLTRFWRIVSVNFAIGVLTWTVQFFQAIFEAIDQSIYAVDEWLRFQEGDGRGSIWFKALFGAVWFAFTYLFRFAWTLLVEPQINPIKHFPVVTVSHKMLLPLIPSLAKQFAMSEKTMGTIVFGIPGIFGFLVWELKENWKLYRANASPTIRPTIVGSHGEKVRALLRPGFHSGVVPKTFAKLRKATRAGNAKRTAKYRHSLEHTSEAVYRLAERSFVAYLEHSRRWAGVPIHAGEPILTPNRILIRIEWGEHGSATVIALEERGGWVIGSIAEPGRLHELEEDARAAFADALAGLYKLAGVHTVREQAAKVFGPQAFQFDAKPEGLLIPLPDGSLVLHDYDDGPELRTPERSLPTETIVFSACPLQWSDWVQRWEDDAAGKAPKERLVPGWNLLPTSPDEHSADSSRSR